MKEFKSLGIKPEFIRRLEELEIINPTEIQRQVISLLLQSKIDLVGQAQTGTGKTAAFGLPLLHKIDAKKSFIQGLILCPTRELSQQIAKQLFRFTKYSDKIFTEAVYGGEKIEKQISRLSRLTHVLVATPGRLIDLVNRDVVDLKNVEIIVLDEADEMLSMGFKRELDKILDLLPDLTSKWLFSATMPHDIKQIVDKHMSPNVHRISVSEDNVVNSNIDHKFLLCDDVEKLNILMYFIKSVKGKRGIIFCKTKDLTKRLADQLNARNILTDAIHGDLLQKERDKVLRLFKNETFNMIVATDLAARGLDVPDLDYVVHYQLPDQHEYYIHRSGRTARAGNEGLSLVLANSYELRKIRGYEDKLRISFSKIKYIR